MSLVSVHYFCHEKGNKKRGKFFVTIYQHITTLPDCAWSFTSRVWVTHSTVQPSSQGKPFLCLNTWTGASGSQAGLCLGSSYVAIGTLPSCRAIISVPTRKLDNYREKQQARQSFLLCQVFLNVTEKNWWDNECLDSLSKHLAGQTKGSNKARSPPSCFLVPGD